MTRVVFLGTPQAAVPSLELLVSSYDVGLVITQPDRPRGRSGTPSPPPVKQKAHALGLPLAQPDNRKSLETAIGDGGPFEIGVVVAYGRILQPEVLAMPAFGLLNVHFSLLPRWRGAAPVARALMAGDPMTGVTIMRIDAGLDTGPILTAQAVDILDEENAGQLTERLAHLGARLLVESVDPYIRGDLLPVPQTDEGATHAAKLEADDRPIDVHSSTAAVVDRIRGLAPAPAATLQIDGASHKILAARRHDSSPEPGTWVAIDGFPIVGLSDGGLELVRLQPPGRNVLSGADWLRGARRESGQVG